LNLRVVTGNSHKVHEFRSILAAQGYNLTVEPLAGGDVVECGATYYQNAYRKARSGMRGEPSSEEGTDIILADDSGLELEEFGCMPGVHSARFSYAGLLERAALSRFLLDQGTPLAHGWFVCWIVAFLPGVPQCVSACGRVKGIVRPEPRGTSGFGYDPLFVPDGYSNTFAELGPEVKDRISHRSRAIEGLLSIVEAKVSLRP